jgi:hypothetical protein
MDPDNPAGNYIAIAMKESDIVIILAHLEKGSIKVKNGNAVLEGQIIASVGNSGNTTEPHLHMHSVVNHTGDFLFSAKGIPMKFQGKFLVRNDRYESPP